MALLGYWPAENAAAHGWLCQLRLRPVTVRAAQHCKADLVQGRAPVLVLRGTLALHTRGTAAWRSWSRGPTAALPILAEQSQPRRHSTPPFTLAPIAATFPPSSCVFVLVPALSFRCIPLACILQRFAALFYLWLTLCAVNDALFPLLCLNCHDFGQHNIG